MPEGLRGKLGRFPPSIHGGAKGAGAGGKWPQFEAGNPGRDALSKLSPDEREARNALRELRAHQAEDRIAGLMGDPDPRVQLQAAQWLAERHFGKATQPQEHRGGAAFVLIGERESSGPSEWVQDHGPKVAG